MGEAGSIFQTRRRSNRRTSPSREWKWMCITSRLAHGWQSQSPGLSFDALHPLTFVLSLPHSAHRRIGDHVGWTGLSRPVVRRNDSEGGILNVHYLALIARMAEPVAWFEDALHPLTFVLSLPHSAQSAIVGTLRREKRDHVRLDRSIQVAGAAMDLVRRNDRLYLGRELSALPRDYSTVGRASRLVYSDPRGFVLTALGASAIVGTLRRVQSLRVRRRH